MTALFKQFNSRLIDPFKFQKYLAILKLTIYAKSCVIKIAKRKLFLFAHFFRGTASHKHIGPWLMKTLLRNIDVFRNGQNRGRTAKTAKQFAGPTARDLNSRKNKILYILVTNLS